MKASHLILIVPALLFAAGGAWAESSITRTLTASPIVPAGDSVRVENLAGHMTVSQGASFKVTAMVEAGGDQAPTLVQSVHLEVTHSGDQITVHVHYPVDQYREYRYTAGDDHDKVCVLDIVCIHGTSNSEFDYQGQSIRVYQGGNEGVPLYVNVAVQLPTGMRAALLNGAGLLQASNLDNPLDLETKGGDIDTRQINGALTARTQGGDLDATQLKSDAQLNTGGGDITVNGIAGTLHAASSGGDITGTDIAGTLQALSSGGDVRLSGELSALTQLNVRTGGGDLRVSGKLVDLHTLSVSTGGGDAVLRVTGLSMHLEAHADGGDVTVHLPDVSDTRSGDGYFSGDVGKAVGQGTISSGGGDISVTQP